ncbi:MAG: CcoQ/FixQ family Cbb3-type cytochrome c oxidase assembly chaperone [Bacteroidetes bacterium]|nr:CcoQ/FixQ family Cbb3-type cytochrome c oxidase assembly chaperone [Bacteroidota bacterium]
MKFINYLKSIDNVSIYPMISFALFGGVFIFVLIYIWKASNQYIDQAKQIPLNDEK